MENDHIVLLRIQVCGWDQSNMVAIRDAVDSNKPDDLKRALKEAAHALVWGGVRFSNAVVSLPYHVCSEQAARILATWREIEAGVMDQLKAVQPEGMSERDGQSGLVFRFVNPELNSQDVIFARVDGRQQSDFVLCKFQNGVYSPSGIQLG